MNDFKATLTKKLGPLPVWAYPLIIAGLAYAWYWWKSRHSASGTVTDAAAAQTQSDAATYDTSAPDYGLNGTGGGIGAGGSTGGTTTIPDNSVPTSNAAWQSLATSYLVGMGYSATAVEQALNNWLLGLQASPQDNALFNLAVARFDQPPEGVPPQPVGSTTPSPALPGGTTQPPGQPKPPTGQPKPPVPPSTHKTYTIVHGDTLTGIAHRFGISEPALYAANHDVIESTARKYGHPTSRNGDLIFPEEQLVIPG